MSIINFPLGSASKQAKAGLNRRKMDPTTMNDDQRAEWEARKEKMRVAARNNRKKHPEPVQSPPIVPPGKKTRVKAVEAGPSITSKRRTGPSMGRKYAEADAYDVHTRQRSPPLPLILANRARDGSFSSITEGNNNLSIPSRYPRRSARIPEASSSEARQTKAAGVEAQQAEEMYRNDELGQEDLSNVKVNVIAEKSAEPQVSVKREYREYLVLVEDPTPTRYINEADSDGDLGYGSDAPAAITRNGNPTRTRCGTLSSNTNNDDPLTLRQFHRVRELEVAVRRLKEELANLQEVADAVVVSVENGFALVPGAESGNNGDLEMELGEGDAVLGKQEDRAEMFIDAGVQTTPQDQLEGNTEIERFQIQGQCAETTVSCVSCEDAQVEIRKLNSELLNEGRNLIESEKWATSCNEDLNDFLLSASPQTQSRLDFLGRLAMHCSGLRVYGGRIKTEHGADTHGLLRVTSRIQEDLGEEVMKEDEGERKMRNLSSVRLTSKDAAPLANPKMPSNMSKNANGKRTRGDGYIHDDEPCESGGSHNTLYRRGETSRPSILKKLRFE